MKLTREQVSQLSDVELNRGMVWCYPPKGYHFHADRVCHWLLLGGKVDYLTDYNLTMPLAFENKLSIFEELDLYAVEAAPLNQFIIRLANKNPLRAICEVLLLIAMEREA